MTQRDNGNGKGGLKAGEYENSKSFAEFHYTGDQVIW